MLAYKMKTNVLDLPWTYFSFLSFSFILKNMFLAYEMENYTLLKSVRVCVSVHVSKNFPSAKKYQRQIDFKSFGHNNNVMKMVTNYTKKKKKK